MSDASGTSSGPSKGPSNGPSGGCGALLFDVGNVLVQVDFMRVFRHWADRSRSPVEALLDRFSPDVAYERHERGEIDAAAYFDSLRESLDLTLGDEEIATGWNMVFVDEVPGIRDVLASAARHAPLYAFSNTNDTHYLEWSTRFSDLLEPFEEIFASCRIARRKPEREAYELVARRIGVPIEEIVFFDDSHENVVGARDAGMRAVQVESAEDVRMTLADLLGEDWER